MAQIPSLEEFLAGDSWDVPLLGFTLNLLAASLLAYVLGRIYVRFGSSLSDRRGFAGNFVLLTATTTLVITIVKSSLALSLGLVGALSIVRFRAAIKEPEELAFLFLAIGIGLGFGADQGLITATAFAVIIALILLRGLIRRRSHAPNLYLTVSSPAPGDVSLRDLVEMVTAHSRAASLTRFDEDAERLEATFHVELDGFEQLNETSAALRKRSGAATISFVDARGLP